MKRYILFGLSLLMVFPLAVSAQDDDSEEEGTETQVRGFAIKQKKYETRNIAGRVVNAATSEPVSGAIIHAAEIEPVAESSAAD